MAACTSRKRPRTKAYIRGGRSSLCRVLVRSSHRTPRTSKDFSHKIRRLDIKCNYLISLKYQEAEFDLSLLLCSLLSYDSSK